MIAPSWSWVNKGKIENFIITPKGRERCRLRRHLQPEFSILNSEYAVEGNNPLGRLKQATITLRARTIAPRAKSIKLLSLCWVWEKTPKSLALIHLDWFCESRQLSMSRRQWKRLRFLVIASCCSNVETPTVQRCWNCKERVANPTTGRLKCTNCDLDFTEKQFGMGYFERKPFLKTVNPISTPLLTALFVRMKAGGEIYGALLSSLLGNPTRITVLERSFLGRRMVALIFFVTQRIARLS